MSSMNNIHCIRFKNKNVAENALVSLSCVFFFFTNTHVAKKILVGKGAFFFLTWAQNS